MNFYHKILRSACVIVALVLVFDSGLFAPVTKDMSRYAQKQVATAVGVSAGVEQNEINELTAQISARERELDQREAALRQREIDARAVDNSSGITDLSTYILSSILFLMLVLIVLNYILDFMRTRERQRGYAAGT